MVIDNTYSIAIENEHLAQANVLSLFRGNTEVCHYLMDTGYLERLVGNNFTFNFVGLISFNDTIICVLPKYYKGHFFSADQIISEFSIIIKTLKKIGYTDSIPDSKNLNTNEHLHLSEAILADKFLRDYLDYGVFIKNKDSILMNVPGEVNWDATINGMTPIISKGRPIYYNTFASSVTTDEFNLISELHKWVIKHYLHKFGRILDFNFSFSEDCVNNYSELGTADYIKNVLRKELSITFTDREILLLKRLISFLDRIQDTSTEKFTLYGTGYFHIVWEKACSAIFDNKVDLFKSHIPFPTWNDLNGNSIAKKTLIPDIISTIEGVNSRFFIFDAKYYNITYFLPPGFDVCENPGIGDISKQYLYELAFMHLPYTFRYNCFLYPKSGSTLFNTFGFVNFSLFGKNCIYNIYLSPNIVFQGFLNNKLIGKLALSNLADSLDLLNKSVQE